MWYADVCVNTPLGRKVASGPTSEDEPDPLGQTFTYAVSSRLAGQLQPGHLAWVSLRGRRMQGIVLKISDTPPAFRTHEIVSLVEPQPLLTPTQIALAYWVSNTYLAPLIESLLLMLPVGLSQRGRTVFVRTETPAPADLTPTQAALLACIAAKEGEWAEVSEGLRGVTQKADLQPLIAKELVTQEVAFPNPPPRPKTDRQVRLLADAEAIRRALPALGRASKQAEVLGWLCGGSSKSANRQIANAESESSARSSFVLAEVCAAVGCTEGPVKALAERGWVTITPRSAQTPASVTLNLASEAVVAALIDLRGAQKHWAVLEALLKHDGPAWIGWVYAETGASLDTLRDLEAAGLITIAEEMVWRDPLAGREFTLDQPPVLTEDQERVWEAVNQRIANCKSANQRIANQQIGDSTQSAICNLQFAICNVQSAILLHGVTGSGKTEIYLRAIGETLRRGRQAVVLVPEIALTSQTIRRFAARFPGKVTVWHSELGEGERFDVWRRVRTNHAASQVVVGSRSALFLPFPDLGLIVVDEEHEPSYKQERTPRYHARSVALELGRLCHAPVLLGSATPALETYYVARQGEIELLALPKRIRTGTDEHAGVRFKPEALLPEANGDLPPVRVVDMRQELRAGNRSIFSRALASGLRHVLAAGQQAILYLNRRGAATFVMCRDCGYVEACRRCATPLTYHSAGETLLCHHCNRRYPVPVVCPKCQSKRIRFFGAGTENVEEAVKLEFPQARTLRWDRDVTGAKGSHDAILARFVAHEADVLIGTQMIAKGLDLPLVTLVGVIAADVGLFLPDFRAGERTFQLLTQVAGRAGRSVLGGEVIVQTYHPDHYAVLAASRHDYEGFYRQEMAFRREQGYPPVRRLARLVYHHSKREQAQAEATRLAELLRAEIEKFHVPGTSQVPGASPDTDLIGPAPCFFAMQRGEYRWQVIVRSPDPAALLRRIPIPLGWRLDIDPVDLL
jgi:primosomal protein N' (replication factor Y)